METSINDTVRFVHTYLPGLYKLFNSQYANNWVVCLAMVEVKRRFLAELVYEVVDMYSSGDPWTIGFDDSMLNFLTMAFLSTRFVCDLVDQDSIALRTCQLQPFAQSLVDGAPSECTWGVLCKAMVAHLSHPPQFTVEQITYLSDVRKNAWVDLNAMLRSVAPEVYQYLRFVESSSNGERGRLM